MKLKTLCLSLALCAVVLTSGCRTTARRYACPPTVVSYAPVATPCCPPAPCGPVAGVVAGAPPAGACCVR